MGSVSRLPSRSGALRWHPYHANTSLPPSAQPCPLKPATSTSPTPVSNRHSHLNTPVSTLVTSCKSIRNNLPSSSKQSQLSSYQLISNRKDRQDAKKAQKEKFENALKELAVQRLTDIWKETNYVTCSARPQTSTVINFTESGTSQPPKQTHVQLPSPCTPTIQTFSSPEQPKIPYATDMSSSSRRMPLRAFVHEMLRRSKTAWPALQIALCYLDAVKSKVPNAIAEAQSSQGLQAAEAVLDSLFYSAQVADIPESSQKCDTPGIDCLTPETQISSPSSTSGNARRLSSIGDDVAPPVQPYATQPSGIASASQGNDMVSRCAKRRRMPTTWSITPLPPRPSPLLCPRRMFIAALILATKFTQDRVYSNRVWAKICGLDAREVSRCERALGAALEWRLWVGKGMADEPTQFLRNFLLAEESSVGKTKTANANASVTTATATLYPATANSCSSSGGGSGMPLTRSLSDSAVLIGNNSCTDDLSADLRSAFKRSSSMADLDLTPTRSAASSLSSSSTSTVSSYATLSDPTTMILTPVNADLDAMESECSSGDAGADNHNNKVFSSGTPSLVYSSVTSVVSSLSETTPFSMNEYSFNPKMPYSSLPSPPCSHFSPYHHYGATGEQHQNSMYSYKPYKPPGMDDAPFGFDPVKGYISGLEGTLTAGVKDINDIYF